MASGQWLSIEGLRFECVIGVTDRERQAPQEIVVNVKVKIDFSKAAASDTICDTVDYRRIAEAVVAAGRHSQFQLIEALSDHLCRTVFETFPSVQAVRLELEKLRALSAARSIKAIVSARRPAR